MKTVKPKTSKWYRLRGREGVAGLRGYVSARPAQSFKLCTLGQGSFDLLLLRMVQVHLQEAKKSVRI